MFNKEPQQQPYSNILCRRGKCHVCVSGSEEKSLKECPHNFCAGQRAGSSAKGSEFKSIAVLPMRNAKLISLVIRKCGRVKLVADVVKSHHVHKTTQKKEIGLQNCLFCASSDSN